MTRAVAFKGQLYRKDATSTKFVYPLENQDWSQELEADPRGTLEKLNINDDCPCYTIKLTKYGIIYAFRKRLTYRAASDCAMVMLLADGPARNGKRLVEILHDLLDYALSLESTDQINTTFLREKLSSCDDLFDSRHKPNISLKKVSEESNSIKDSFRVLKPFHSKKVHEESNPIEESFRVYKTDDELFKILENPYQPTDDKKFKCKHIIPFNVDRDFSMVREIQFIQHPLEKTYFFNLPQDVEVKDQKNYIGEKESFSLIYKRTGYKDYESGPLYINDYNPRYFSIIGNEIYVKRADECNILFKRPISFVVLDNQNNLINNWVCIINGNIYNVTKANEDFLLRDGTHSVSIQADGYEDQRFDINTKDRQRYPITLSPKGLSKEVILKPMWSKKCKFWKKGKKYSTEPVTIKYSSNSFLYERYPKLLDNEKTPTFYVTHKNPLYIWVIFCIAAMLIGACFGPFVKDKIVQYQQQKEVQTVSQESGNNNGTEQAPQQEAKLENQQEFKQGNQQGTSIVDSTLIKEKLDEDYLNNNYVWEYSKLQSDKYKYFFNTVLTNDISYGEVDWDDYKNITNDGWLEIYDRIRKGLDSVKWGPFQSIKYQQLKNQIKDKKLDLDEAIEPKSNNKNNIDRMPN